MNRLQGKDLINIGIFTAIYFIVIFAAASIGFIPIFIPLISVIVPLVGGIPMMLFFSKIKKFGMLTICGVLLGIIMLLTGMGWSACCMKNRLRASTVPASTTTGRSAPTNSICSTRARIRSVTRCS